MEDIENLKEKSLVRSTVFLFAFALLALCVFQSSALLTLSYDLPAGGWTENVIAIAEGWHNLMVRCGAAQITESVSEFVASIHQMQIRQ